MARTREWIERCLALKDADTQTMLAEESGGCEADWPGTDDDHIEVAIIVTAGGARLVISS
jgi:hypothetical protein